MARNARAQERRPTLCHAKERTAAGADACEVAPGATQTLSNGARESAHRVSATEGTRTTLAVQPPRADNFCVRRESNAESRLAGARFEAHALAFLRRQRLVLVARNVHCRGGELDLVMRERDGTLVFVEVRARSRRGYGGAAASVDWHKQQRILRAARYFLSRGRAAEGAYDGRHVIPACRFDVIAFECGRLVWLRDAFRADGS
ncbi:YraN family protein [Paraburkholderia denitrificans]|uniref:UPF0102 protein ACFPTO_11315 n=1 Tax=Paraburkholderia denitrificans TaxID=694025 RepID=A0ABW0J8W3_9BURK